MEKHWIICLICNKTFLQALKLKDHLTLLEKHRLGLQNATWKKSRGKEVEYFPQLHVSVITTGVPLLLFGGSRSVLSFSSLGMEIKASTLEALVIRFLQFSLWKPSYLLTESLCTKTPSLACPAVCSAHLWERFGFDKNYGNVFLLTWGGNHIQQEYSAFQSEGSLSAWQTDIQTSQQEH